MSHHDEEETEATTIGELRDVLKRALTIARKANDRTRLEVEAAIRHVEQVVSSEFMMGIEHIARLPPQQKLRGRSQKAFDAFVTRYPIVDKQTETVMTPLSVEEWAMLRAPDSMWRQGTAYGKKAGAIYQ